MASSERFGFEWDKYSAIETLYESQFKNWIGPLQAKDFEHKSVLDAGCGMGRNSYWPLKYGAKRVVAFDLDERSIRAARRNLSDFSNSEVYLKSIYDIDWQNEFDLAFSIGVIHHLKEPKTALRNLVKSVKDGGRILVWVYSYEGNAWIVKLVNPIRKHFTSKLPVGLVHFLSYFCSIPLWIFVKLFKGPSDYLKQLSTFKFWHIHSIVFDQLIPEVANYWKKEEIKDLFTGIGLRDFKIVEPSNRCGWIVLGEK